MTPILLAALASRHAVRIRHAARLPGVLPRRVRRSAGGPDRNIAVSVAGGFLTVFTLAGLLVGLGVRAIVTALGSRWWSALGL
jgi:hypothetical protein